MSEERNEEFLNEMLALTKQNVLTWHNMVEKLSSNDDRITKWNDILKRNIEDVYNDIFADVSDNQEKLLNGIEQLLQQSEVLCKSLHIKMPNYGSDGLGLYEEQEILMNMIAKFEVQLEKKTKEITKLIEEEQNLCKALGCEQMKLQLSPLPTEDVIEKFKTHLEMLESEKFDRDEKYLKIKSSILDIVNIINYRPQLDFERTVLSHNDSLFLVTEENMERLEQFHTKLEMQYNKIKERIDILKDRLKRLWEILSEDIQKCNEFLEENVGVNYDTLRAYEDEVKRCEALKSANIEKFIKQLREEMELLWDKCHMTCAEKKTFQYFEDSIYNEDLLTLHDHEIQRLKTFYNKNCELFELLDKRNEHWKKLEELDQQALAPDRYKNRGGQLLLEEKQRNFLRKGIPKIEQKLVELSEKYERETGKVFTSWGKTIGSLIEDTADNYIYKKKIQLSARKQQRDQTITPGKSIPSLSTAVSSQNLAFLTPSTLKQISQNLGVRPIKSTVKRKLLTPIPNDGKRLKVLGNNNVSKTAPCKIIVTDHSRKQSRSSLKHGHRIRRYRRNSQKKINRLRRSTTIETSTGYSGFEDSMQNKTNCRSTSAFENSENRSPDALPLPQTPACSRTPKRALPSPTGRAGCSRTNTSPHLKTPRLTAAPCTKLVFY